MAGERHLGVGGPAHPHLSRRAPGERLAALQMEDPPAGRQANACQDSGGEATHLLICEYYQSPVKACPKVLRNFIVQHYRWKIRLLDANPMPARILEVRS